MNRFIQCAMSIAVFTTASLTFAERVLSQTEDDLRLYDIPDYYIGKMGEKLDVHFTMHLLGDDTFARTKEPLDPTVNTINELIKELEAKIPDARVVLDRQDKDHPVIHLVDKALGKQNEVLDRKIDLTYHGIVGKLPDELQKTIPNIGPRTGGGGSGFGIATDLITHVDIDVKQQSIRNILTHCVDLDTYDVVTLGSGTTAPGKQRCGMAVPSRRSRTKHKRTLHESPTLLPLVLAPVHRSRAWTKSSPPSAPARW